MTKLYRSRWATMFVIVAAVFSLITRTSLGWADDSASDDSPVPELTIQTLPDVALGNGDLADIHFPNIPSQLRDAFTNTFPIVALLQGANVDKAQYKPFARRLARRGFVVAVANHVRPLPPFIPVPGLYAGTSVITAVQAKMASEDGNVNSSLYKIVDTQLLALVGHSFGGVAGLLASGNVCLPPFCETFPLPFPRPQELKAAVFYGTDLVSPPVSVPQGFTEGVKVALMQGSRDSLSTPAESAATYPLLAPLRALITIHGANHYGICKDNNPTGANPDPNAPTLSQSDAIALSAKWTALWLRAQLKSDAMAKFKFYGLVSSDDDEVGIQTH